MKVAELLRTRRDNWKELDVLCAQLENRRRRSVPPATTTRFAALYRAACADLALAEAHQLPPGTVAYLHRLVGRAHNQFYRSRTFNWEQLRHELLEKVPRRLFADPCVWLAFTLFWGIFLLSMLMGAETKMPLTGRPLATGFAERLVGEKALHEMEQPFIKNPFGANGDLSSGMAARYIMHNTGIGLKCFATGLIFGIGGVFELVFEAAYLGAQFGFMFRSSGRSNFLEFVTAHGPFELTAIVLSAAGGMRLGFSLISTRGRSRMDSLNQSLKEVVPTLVAACLLFFGAALIEGFISPSALPYAIKAIVGGLSSALLLTYFVLLGWPQPGDDEENASDRPEEDSQTSLDLNPQPLAPNP
ncbi:MAG: stage II sporulation protein M [Planctomycetes bacterium]|nr:stage II sporulation protein M [Planctomycetota bacterium]